MGGGAGLEAGGGEGGGGDGGGEGGGVLVPAPPALAGSAEKTSTARRSGQSFAIFVRAVILLRPPPEPASTTSNYIEVERSNAAPVELRASRTVAQCFVVWDSLVSLLGRWVVAVLRTCRSLCWWAIRSLRRVKSSCSSRFADFCRVSLFCSSAKLDCQVTAHRCASAMRVRAASPPHIMPSAQSRCEGMPGQYSVPHALVRSSASACFSWPCAFWRSKELMCRICTLCG